MFAALGIIFLVAVVGAPIILLLIAAIVTEFNSTDKD